MIEEQERPKALERLAAGRARGLAKQHGYSVSGESPQTTPQCVADIAAEAVGMSRQTYHKAKAIVAAAETDPQKFGVADSPEGERSWPCRREDSAAAGATASSAILLPKMRFQLLNQPVSREENTLNDR
jgi:hypothetical protein